MDSRPDVTRAAPARALDALVAASLVLLVAAVFGQTARFGFVNYDDQLYVYANPLVRRGLSPATALASFGAFMASNWHPLTWLSHLLDVSLFGLDPGPHHLVNAAFHAGNVVLLYALLRRMTGAVWRSAVVAAVFAIHPLRAESVAWVSERKDVLSTFLLFLALHAWTSYVRRPRPAAYASTLLLFTASLLAKQTFVTFPVLLLVLDVWPFRRAGPLRLLREKAPFAAISGVMSVVAWLAQRSGHSVISTNAIPFGARIANAIVSYVAYLGDLLWPSRLAAFYPHPVLAGVGTDVARVVVASTILLAVSAVAVAQRARRPWLLAGWCWYLVALLPVIGIVQVGTQARADRYTYVPTIGVVLAIVWGVAEAAARLRGGRALSAGVAVAAVAVLAVLGHAQVATWHDSITLHRNTLANTDRNWQAWTGLGDALSESGQPQEAIASYERALSAKPDFAQAWSGLGVAYGRLGHPDRAVAPLEQAVRLDPSYEEGWYNLGTAYGSSGRHADAVRAFRRAIALNAEDARAWLNLGIASLILGDETSVSESYARLERLDPSNAEKLRAAAESRR